MYYCDPSKNELLPTLSVMMRKEKGVVSEFFDVLKSKKIKN